MNTLHSPARTYLNLPYISMKEPTQEQRRVFWEGYGLKWEDCHWDCPFSPDEHTLLTPKSKHVHLVYPDGTVLLNTTGYYSPPIDLNNLFKYVVPKVLEKLGKYKTVVLVNKAVCDAVEAGGEIKDYLFWALDKVREASNGK